MYGYESWIIKKAEHQRIDALELWCWRRLLRVPWTTRRSKQSILKEIIPEYSLERLTLKLKFQYFDYLMWRITHWKRPWCWERLKARGQEDSRGWDCWMESPTWWTWVWASSRSWWWTGKPDMLQSMGSQRVRHDWATELNWLLVNRNTVFLYFHLVSCSPLLLNWISSSNSFVGSIGLKKTTTLCLCDWLCKSLWLCGSQ